MPKPTIPSSIPASALTRPETPSSLQRAREHEVRNLDARRRELADAQKRVADLERQVSNVERSVEELDEKLAAYTDQERIACLEGEVAGLREELKKHTAYPYYTPAQVVDGRLVFGPGY